jgi:hypothetical protein
MAEANKLTRKELRKFGLITGALFAAIFGLAAPYLRSRSYPLWPWVLCAALAGTAAVWPPALRPVYRVWTTLGEILGWINSRIVLGVMFYGVIMPLGFVMRMFGHDPMARRFDVKVASYRVTSRRAPREGIERPY